MVEWQVVKWRTGRRRSGGGGGGAEQKKVIIKLYRRESQGSAERVCVRVCVPEREKESSISIR